MPEQIRSKESSLAKVQTEIEAEQVGLEQTHALKQGMMQELLTGKNRLV